MMSRTTGLTPKQQHFCRAIASGCTMSGAYREAYDTENMKPASIHREASVLMSNPMVTQRVGRLQRQKDRAVVAAGISDRERVLTKLRDLLDNAQGVPAEQVTLRAADLLGKSVGLFKEIRVQQEPEKSSAELRAELEQLLADVPEDAVH